MQDLSSKSVEDLTAITRIGRKKAEQLLEAARALIDSPPEPETPPAVDSGQEEVVDPKESGEETK